MRIPVVRAIWIVTALLLATPHAAAAEWQFKPFLGVTFGGSITPATLDLDFAAGKPNVVYGGSVTLLGEIFGVDVDFGHAPGFFETGDLSRSPLVSRSSTTTLTGNVVVAVPRRIAQYTLRPYFVVGGGLIRAHIEDVFGALPLSDNMVGLDVGGGVTGFLTNRIGLSWEIRHFGKAGGGAGMVPSGQADDISFWRASMALAFRY
jgi:hypothetical protein